MEASPVFLLEGALVRREAGPAPQTMLCCRVLVVWNGHESVVVEQVAAAIQATLAIGWCAVNTWIILDLFRRHRIAELAAE